MSALEMNDYSPWEPGAKKLGYLTVTILAIVIAAVSFPGLFKSYLAWLNSERGALIQAAVYAAQTLILVAVLFASVRQAGVASRQATLATKQLQTLQDNIKGATIHGLVSGYREIFALAIETDLLEALRTSDASRKADTIATLIVNHVYDAFLQGQLGILTPEIWDGMKRDITENLAKLPRIQKRWWTDKTRDSYPETFKRYLDEVIPRPPKEVPG